ncbi:uncharacterized protein ACWYII_013726 isoform 4-T4 [Salvelinus alpinus]
MAVSFFGKVIIPFLAYFLVEVTGEQQYGGLGGEITLTPKVSGQPEDILWKHIGNKVVEFDGSQNVEYGRYKGRTILDWDSGALTIKGLTDADSGPYELEAVVKGKLQYSHHEVDVIDNVAQPSVTCVVDNTNPENMDRTLLCSADLQPLTQFIWSSPGGSESPGPELFIPGVENQESENQDSVYTCVVKNPVSERTAEFTLKDCHTEGGSSRVLAVVLSILLLLVLVVVLAFLLWCWRKGKKPAKAALKKSEEEAGLLEVTVQVTDTEPVQDKPNPAQPKLVTPESKEAQLGMNTPEPNQETAPERETDSAGTTEPTRGQTDGTTEPARDQTDGTTEPARDQTDGTTEPARDQTDGTTEPARDQTDSAGTTEASSRPNRRHNRASSRPNRFSRHNRASSRPNRRHNRASSRPNRFSRHNRASSRPNRFSRYNRASSRPNRFSRHNRASSRPNRFSRHNRASSRPNRRHNRASSRPNRRHNRASSRPNRFSRHNRASSRPNRFSRHNRASSRPNRFSRHNRASSRPNRFSRHNRASSRPNRFSRHNRASWRPNRFRSHGRDL